MMDPEVKFFHTVKQRIVRGGFSGPKDTEIMNEGWQLAPRKRPIASPTLACSLLCFNSPRRDWHWRDRWWRRQGVRYRGHWQGAVNHTFYRSASYVTNSVMQFSHYIFSWFFFFLSKACCDNRLISDYDQSPWQICLRCAHSGSYTALYDDLSKLNIFLPIWNDMQDKRSTSIILQFWVSTKWVIVHNACFWFSSLCRPWMLIFMREPFALGGGGGIQHVITVLFASNP